jgi:ribosomal-protein-alanine N-acetyltransferase
MRWWHIEAALPIERDLFGDEEWSAATFWSELAQADTRYYRVAMEGESVIGYAGLCTYGEESWVQNLAVRADWQGKGIGALLLDDLLAEAARRSSVRVALEVRADNATAQRLYARRGFEPVAVRRGYYQPSNADALVMVREQALEGHGSA